MNDLIFRPTTQTDLASLSVRGGRSKASRFFRNLGHSIEHVAKDVGSEIVNQGVDSLKNSVVSGIQNQLNPTSLAEDSALAGAGLHKRHKKHFDKHLHEMMHQEKMKGCGFSLKKLVNKAYSKASNAVKNEARNTIHHVGKYVKNEYDTKIKPDYDNAKNELTRIARRKINNTYNEGKNALREKLGLANDMPSSHTESQVEDYQPQDEEEEMAYGSGMKMRKRKAPTQRNILVGKLMKQHGLSLGEASKYIKEHHLL